MDSKVTNKEELNNVFTNLVICVCALEQYVNCGEFECDPIVDAITMSLRNTINTMEETLRK